MPHRGESNRMMSWSRNDAGAGNIADPGSDRRRSGVVTDVRPVSRGPPTWILRALHRWHRRCDAHGEPTSALSALNIPRPRTLLRNRMAQCM